MKSIEAYHLRTTKCSSAGEYRETHLVLRRSLRTLAQKLRQADYTKALPNGTDEETQWHMKRSQSVELLFDQIRI